MTTPQTLQQPEAPLQTLRQRLMPFFIILVCVFAVYTPALTAGFVWDDDDHFTENPYVTTPSGIVEVWTSAKAIYYPLTLTTWWGLHRLFGLHPLPYHAITILFHALAAWLFALLLDALKVKGSLLAALLFALHPVQVESVAWATELKNTQSGVFFFLTLLLYVRYDDTRRVGLYWASLVAFLAALLSKPSVTPLPGVLVVLLWWREGRLDLRRLLPTLPFFALSALSAAWTIWEQKHHSNAKGPEWDQTLLERALIAGNIVWFYLEKLAWPDPLMFIYPRWEVSTKQAGWYLPLGALLGVAAIFAALAWKTPFRWRRHPLAVLLLNVGLLFPVLGFFNIYFMRFSFVADHFQYLAVAPIFAAIGGIAAYTMEFLDREVQLGARAVAATILAALGLLSWKQSHIYKNEMTLWLDTLRKNPYAWIAYNNLGFELARQNNYVASLAQYQRALNLKADYEEAYNNLGVSYLKLNEPENAIEPLERALAVKPDYYHARINLGNAYAFMGRLGDAIVEYEKALELNNEDPIAHRDLATILARARRYADARRHLQEVLRLDPDNREARERLAFLEE